MKKLLVAILLVALLVSVPFAALANSGKVSINRLMENGWQCIPIGGEPHCFDPGDGKSTNASTVNVMVFDQENNFKGTEILWNTKLYAGQPCPQDQILNLGFAFACHHYNH